MKKIDKVEFSTKTKDPRQMNLPLDRYDVRSKGTDKNLLMEYVESVPKGTEIVPSRYNPYERCEA